MKTAFLQERKIERIVYLHPPKEANTSKIWKLQKCVYWRQNNTLIGILARHVENMIWGGNQYFKGSIITKLKDIFNFGPGEMEAFTYIGIELK